MIQNVKAIRTIGILPIKKHSERVPNKNFRELGLAPLWMHPIGKLVESQVVDKIVIDTDCPEVFGNQLSLVPIITELRPTQLRGDEVSMNDILADVVRRHKAEIYIQVHATNPFVHPDTLAEAYMLVAGRQYDSVYAATEYRSRFYFDDGKPINHDPTKLIPTQALRPIYEENSAFYVFRREPFLTEKRRICGNSFGMIIPAIEAIDIDTPDDWKLAEIVARGLREMPATKP